VQRVPYGQLKEQIEYLKTVAQKGKLTQEGFGREQAQNSQK